MVTALKLEEIRDRCLELDEGENEEFCIGEAINQDEASKFAGSINQKREGHVWIDVLSVGHAPDPTTKIHVRCTA